MFWTNTIVLAGVLCSMHRGICLSSTWRGKKRFALIAAESLYALTVGATMIDSVMLDAFSVIRPRESNIAPAVGRK